MSFFAIISPPVALYNNLPIAPQNFQPSLFAITAISFGQTTTFTLANGTNNVAPNYVVGQLVRITIPPAYGARQLSGLSGYVIALPASNQVTVAINSVGTDQFIASPTFKAFQQQTLPQLAAIGDVNSGQINASGNLIFSTNIPGSFENISNP